MVRFKEKSYKVFFKYETLPTFSFVCGRLRHQVKDCEAMRDIEEEFYEDVNEQKISWDVAEGFTSTKGL